MNKKLSVIIITLNEQRNIERCLKSVSDFADEIIVVDSYSDDKTKEICKRFPVKFIQSEWQGYSKTKNYANSHAKYDYIFSIDADEEVSKELIVSINEQKEKGLHGAYFMNRLNNYCGKWIKHGGWYPDRKLRIWNRKDAEWQGNIHEKQVFNNKTEMSLLHGDLFHYSFKTIVDHKNQMRKFATLHAEEMFRNGKKVNSFLVFIKVAWKFKRDYFFKLGFLDGKCGFIICRINTYGTYLKYKILKELNKK
ncbi:MAG: glycosyltransferase family 2 protein [Bacteroidota bacterium]